MFFFPSLGSTARRALLLPNNTLVMSTTYFKIRTLPSDSVALHCVHKLLGQLFFLGCESLFHSTNNRTVLIILFVFWDRFGPMTTNSAIEPPLT